MSFDKPWLVVPLVCALIVAVIFGLAAWLIERKKDRPRDVRAKGLVGIVRDTTKLTLVGSGAGWITAILSNDLNSYRFIRHAMAATLIISLIAAILNFYASAAIDTHTSTDGKSVTIKTVVWPIVHGVIFALSLSASIILLIAVVAVSIKL